MKKRVLSALLAVGMACSLAATAFATDLPGMATPESASYDLAEQDPAEDAASGEPAAVEAEPTPTPDAAEQPTPTPAPTAAPASTLPPTGDGFFPALWGSLAALSAAGLLLLYRRKRNRPPR